MAKPKRDGLELKMRPLNMDELKAVLTGAVLKMTDYLQNSNDPERVMKASYALTNATAAFMKVLEHDDLRKKVEELDEQLRAIREGRQ